MKSCNLSYLRCYRIFVFLVSFVWYINIICCIVMNKRILVLYSIYSFNSVYMYMMISLKYGHEYTYTVSFQNISCLRVYLECMMSVLLTMQWLHVYVLSLSLQIVFRRQWFWCLFFDSCTPVETYGHIILSCWNIFVQNNFKRRFFVGKRIKTTCNTYSSTYLSTCCTKLTNDEW